MAKSKLLEIKSKLYKINPNIKILSREYNGAHYPILCRCEFDGYKWFATWNNLKQGRGCSKCSGKLKRTLAEIIELLKDISPNIEILSDIYVNNSTKLHCKCKIDNHEWEATWNNLQKGKRCPKCANNLKRTLNDIKKKMKIIDSNIQILSEKYENNITKLLCKCNLDNYEWYTNWANLSQGRGCPRCNASKGEKSILNYLIKQKLLFEQQYIFDNLLSLKGNPLKFDFSLFDQHNNLVLLIEYDGEQHYKPVDFKNVGITSTLLQFEKQKHHDKLKNQYCKQNNIPLIRIPYWQFDKIEQILDKWLKKYELI